MLESDQKQDLHYAQFISADIHYGAGKNNR